MSLKLNYHQFAFLNDQKRTTTSQDKTLFSWKMFFLRANITRKWQGKKYIYVIKFVKIINRPSVAGAVLQTALLLIDWLIMSLILFLQIFTTIRTRELKLLENVHPTRCVMCQVSHVTCHLSCVTCHLSNIYIYIYILYIKIGQISGATWLSTGPKLSSFGWYMQF